MTILKQDHGVSAHVAENLQALSALLGQSEEIRTMCFERGKQYYGLACLDSMTDQEVLQKYINYLQAAENGLPSLDILGEETSQNLTYVLEKLTCGYSVLFLEGCDTCLLFPVPLSIERETIQPDHQRIFSGPKDGFVENVRTNLFLIRRRLGDKRLRLRKTTVGTRSKSAVYILYIEDLAPTEIVNTVIRRVEAVTADIVLDSTDLYQYINDSWLSPFPQAEFAERPDVVTAGLCQGRVAILQETSPVALLVPVTFFDLLDVPDDYYTGWSVSASIIRFIRMTAVFLATFVPSFYIALTAYNPDFIPTSLAFLIAVSREGTPFPVPLEAFLVVSIMEIGREAFLRLHKTGALIIGIISIAVIILAAAFSLISYTMVIIILFGTICSSVIPDNELRISIRELQFFFMILASFLGIFGVAMAFFYTGIHAVNLKSFGIPFMTPLAPAVYRDWGRIFFRLPAWALPRLKSYHSQDQDRFEKTIDRKEGVPLEKDPR